MLGAELRRMGELVGWGKGGRLILRAARILVLKMRSEVVNALVSANLLSLRLRNSHEN